ncbi:leucine-rich repeat-containing protein 4c-like [Plakobranchus ocellatus]|uniref:Leucine-rich repeat-containing protein 4c-like n=1 Tax=Plakobranchus ocellatus TaxID=259542 RepID=A0AAV4CVR2_9GAST|nr:leucine-rich repeat-containing protein 4c-like [Plakobranchus ocellatus]
MHPHLAMYAFFLLALSLDLAASFSQSNATNETHNLESSCPQKCLCLDESEDHISVTCKVYDLLEWEGMCRDISLLKENKQKYLNLKLLGESNLFSSSLGCLPQLNILDLAGVSLTLAPYMFETLQVVSTLNLSANGLTNIPDETFIGILTVSAIDLSNNRLKELKTKAFAGLENTEHLDLSYNNVSVIHQGSLANISGLKFLSLKSNSLHTFSFSQLSPNASLDFLSLRDNFLTSLYLESNETEAVPFHTHSQFDISNNLIECSCSLAYFLQALPFSENSLVNVHNTLCDSPENLQGQSIAHLDSSGLVCTAPEIFMSYPLKHKHLLTTSSITLECHTTGFPHPSVMWITPWGDHFIHDQAHIPNSLKKSLENGAKIIKAHRKYREPNVLMVTTIQSDRNGHLVISKIRGSMSGNYTCFAFNPAGNASRVMDMSLFCGIDSTYTYSLILGGYCASGFLIFGFLVGFIKMLVVWLRHKLYFIVPYFSKAASTATAAPYLDHCTASICGSSNTNAKSGVGSGVDSSASFPNSPTLLSYIEEENLGDSEQGNVAAPQRRIRETLEEARGRWRDGMERKMERVKKNVQHIKESGSIYVHNIRESGSSAANRMKAGVALGVETVKYQLQSFKELCGTGDMGTNTISMISVETDVDSHQRSEVVKQITFV